MMYYDQLGGYLHTNGPLTRMRDLCGISSKRVQQLENFVAALISCGADIVFVTNGPFHEVSGKIFPDPECIRESNKEGRYQAQCDIINRLKKEHYREIATDTNFIPIEPIWRDPIIRIAKKYGTLIQAWDNTRHQEIVRYASEKDAFAIISKNFCLLLYAGSVIPKYKLWSLVKCNEKNMTTEQIEPVAVRRTLNLSIKQLRLLGVFCDWYYTTPTFSSFLMRAKIENSTDNLFKDLIDYVKRFVGNLHDHDYLRIALDLYGAEKFTNTCQQLKSVCESYNIVSFHSLIATVQNSAFILLRTT